MKVGRCRGHLRQNPRLYGRDNESAAVFVTSAFLCYTVFRSESALMCLRRVSERMAECYSVQWFFYGFFCP